MRVQGDDRVIDELLGQDGGIVFNLVAFIREQQNAILYTDGVNYLTAQSNPYTPMWIYLKDGCAESELFCVLEQALKQNPNLRINAQAVSENILSRFAKKYGLDFSKHGTLNVYSARNVKEVSPVGNLLVSRHEYEHEIKELIKVASIDDNDGELTDEQATVFAKKHANSDNLFLWYDKEIVSMARIVRYGAYGRITSVVTKRAVRGRGYAKMLVGELAKRLLKEGLIPVLYARAENPSSNACYLNLGFERKGEMCEYTVKIKE